ncbi:hypothetical protein DFR29_104359 [Tahibacter aquaticus]|uniref:Secreted protein n=1 Tax=Tahibacter aquaticus TaxID=520092 RepID=A0A4R6Z2V0_9GAMM|nr:hypothetical protein [Tahibacter aquaticus]TDR45923.1 hypothetical protein DFR29_104359 [Tahibacter aquaticus]
MSRRPILASALLLAAVSAHGNRSDVLQGDAYGHRISADPALCAYEPIDMSAAASLAPIAAGGSASALDDGAAVVDLPQAFPFYGTAPTRLSVSTNGYIAFVNAADEEDGGDYNNDPYVPSLPDNARAGSARLYVYHDELNGEGGGASLRSAYFAHCPRTSLIPDEACSVIAWKGWSRGGSSGSLDVTAVLYHGSGNIALQYASLDASAGNSACIGAQSDGAIDGVSWSCNGGRSLAAATAVCIFDPAYAPPVVEDALFADGFDLPE